MIHYAKVVLDEIFGENNFVNEIIWHKGREGGSYRSHAIGSSIPTEYQNLLVYAKNKKLRYWKQLLGPYKKSTVSRIECDNKGWFYTRGRMGRKPAEGEIEAGVSLKTYVSPDIKKTKEQIIKQITSQGAEFVAIGDVWNKDVIKFSTYTKYPTEKPEALLYLLISAATFKHEDFVERRDEIIRTFVKGDTRPPYVVNTSKLKSPQNIVLVSHSPEKEFVFQLIDNSDYIDSWVKSPDKNFYSIDYEYWKGGKDRVRRSFNPDFFIKIDLDEYISGLENEGGKQDHIEKLRKLQDEGRETLVKVVEIKSDEDQDEATPAKEDYANAHFERVNSKLSTLNPADIESQYRADAKQYYTFDLLTPNQFQRWIVDLKKRNNFPK